MPGTGRLQVVQLDEVVATVSFFLDPASPSRLSLELAGPEPLAMAEVIGLYRSWLGRPAAKVVSLPGWAAGGLYRIGDLAGALGWRPPIRSNAGKEIRRGAVGDPSAWTSATGIRPRPLRAALAANPATVQEKWFAGLYFIKPVIFVVLPFFWIMTGLISLTAGYRSGVELMISTGAGVLSGPAVMAGALADIAAGSLMAWRPTASLGVRGAIALSTFYLVAGTVLRPDLWNEPLGPLLKILPILVLHFVALAILDER
jgi:DoxX-like family